MNSDLFFHLYELDNILFELPVNSMYFRMWQVVEMLSQDEMSAWLMSVTIA